MAVPIDFIDHVELILGPGSVLSGGNAMLGVINVAKAQNVDFRAELLRLVKVV